MSVAVKFDIYLEFYEAALQTYISDGDWQPQYILPMKSGFSVSVLVIVLIAVLLVAGTIIIIRGKH